MSKSRSKRPLLWPGLVIVGIQWMLWFILPFIYPEHFMVAVAAGTFGGAVFLIWWIFFCHLPLIDRIGSLLVMIASVVLFSFLVDESIITGNMGLMFYMYSIPNFSLAVMIALLTGRNFRPALRRTVMGLLVVLAPGIFLFLRSDGLRGTGRAMLNWRWAETDEERLLAAGEDAFEIGATGLEAVSQAEWPGFRGPERNSEVNGLIIETDWKAHPPELLWKQSVGPACSSFAISGDRVYTQEQRGDVELVTCYHIASGGLIWKHEDQARFYDSHAGAGPRATPTLSGERVYTLGATGILNVLDARSGELIWSRPIAEELKMEVDRFGATASPLVVGDAVIIALSGKTAAYHKESSDLLWEGPDGGNSYSSPQLFTIEGIPQVLFMSKKGCASLDPHTGSSLWNHEWDVSDRILQPAMTDDGKLLLTAEITALRCLEPVRRGKEWKLHTKWTSEEVKMNLNDLVVHKNHAYGFDGPFLACVNLETGNRIWRGGRYRGWNLLLADQDLLLILSEKGEVVLVEARPDKFTELGRIQAIEGRTWNHPAMAGNVLLVRNSQEMAAFSLQD